MQFTVSKVQVPSHGVRLGTYKKHFEGLANASLEAVSRVPRGEVVARAQSHQFIDAVGMSFADHYPLILSPDSVWITLTQGLANHINRHAEAVRKRFVTHAGKVKIIVRRDNFIKGADDNDWEGAFNEFSDRIKEHVGDANHQMIVSDFSTTGVIEKAASEVVLMDSMQSYFEYGMMTMCGIPNIELSGNVEDWEKLRNKINGWKFDGEADLSWWTKPLERILDTFVAAAKGNIDREWWESFFKENSGHGSGAVSKVSGWINWLIPYIRKNRGTDLVVNPKMGLSGLEYGDGLEMCEYPSSLSKVPFEWNYFGKIFKMEFLAGISAVVQDPGTLALAPKIGWGVREK